MIQWHTLLTRMAIITVMVVCVSVLMRLFDEPTQIMQTQTHKSNPTVVASMSEHWTGAINYAPAYAALNPFQETASQTTQTLFDPSDDYWGLPRTPGYEVTSSYCAACHSLQIVMQQRQSRDGWDYLLTWMVEKQGMAAPSPEIRSEILNYLAREFPAGGG